MHLVETQGKYKTAWGDSTMGRMWTFVWFSHFRCGETGLRL